MSKAYNWDVKPLSVNFNHKQWRQDFGSFVKNKLFWGVTKVTRSKAISKGPNLITKGIKQFTIYNDIGGEVHVQYQNNNEITACNRQDLIDEYFKERGLK